MNNGEKMEEGREEEEGRESKHNQIHLTLAG